MKVTISFTPEERDQAWKVREVLLQLLGRCRTHTSQIGERCMIYLTLVHALNSANARRDMIARVAAATGCPAELLTGDTEEACTAQAQAITAFANTQQPAGYPNVRDGGTPLHLPTQANTADAFSRAIKHTPKQFKSY